MDPAQTGEFSSEFWKEIPDDILEELYDQLSVPSSGDMQMSDVDPAGASQQQQQQQQQQASAQATTQAGGGLQGQPESVAYWKKLAELKAKYDGKLKEVMDVFEKHTKSCTNAERKRDFELYLQRMRVVLTLIHGTKATQQFQPRMQILDAAEKQINDWINKAKALENLAKPSAATAPSTTFPYSSHAQPTAAQQQPNQQQQQQQQQMMQQQQQQQQRQQRLSTCSKMPQQ
mmetsp:Transcript_7113/g.30317  ORF Transcript_7113/g.30317 Transcript_7113/m.30317 type:complete len:231 (+) Transcript_7113:118-810(+)